MRMLPSLGLLRREFRDHFKFRDLDPSSRSVVFYAEDRAYYSYFEGVIRHLIDAHAIPVCYFTSDPDDPLFETRNPSLHVFYVRQLLPILTASLTAKVLVMTMPDLDRFHVKRSKHSVNHIYLFHNIGSSFPVIRYGALFSYDTIFCVGPHHKQEIRRQEELYGLPQKELVEFGYYRLEKIFEDAQSSTASPNPSAHTKGTILIAPSWGEHSLLHVCGMELIPLLLDAGYTVIVRPHPMTTQYHPQLIARLHAAFQNHPRYIHDDDIASLRSLYKSDVMISDWSGVAYEYSFGTERPVLFVDVPQKIVNARYRDLGFEPIDVAMRRRIGDVLDPQRLSEVDAKITNLLRNRHCYVEAIRAARDELVYNFGFSSEAGAEYIHKYVTQAIEHVGR